MRKGSLDRCDGKKRCDRLGRLWRLRQDTGLAGSETRHQIGRRAARRTNLRGDRGYVDAMRMAAFRGSIRAEGSGLSRRQSPGFSPARAARSLLMDAWISEASRPSIAFTAGGGARNAVGLVDARQRPHACQPIHRSVPRLSLRDLARTPYHSLSRRETAPAHCAGRRRRGKMTLRGADKGRRSICLRARAWKGMKRR